MVSRPRAIPGLLRCGAARLGQGPQRGFGAAGLPLGSRPVDEEVCAPAGGHGGRQVDGTGLAEGLAVVPHFDGGGHAVQRRVGGAETEPVDVARLPYPGCAGVGLGEVGDDEVGVAGARGRGQR